MRHTLVPALLLSLALAHSASGAVIQVRERTDGKASKPKISWVSSERHHRTMERAVASGKTPSIAAFGLNGTGLRLVAPRLSDSPTYRVKGVGRDGSVGLRVMMPVSGDISGVTPGELATRTTFAVTLRRPDGSVHRQELPAAGLVTRADLRLRLGTGDNLLTIAPTQSGGRFGFPGARELVLRVESPTTSPGFATAKGAT